MIQSIKVDIVYYSIGSDFEMEFNLCGCCRMRLLTDKVQSQSELSKSLSRAVKRSRVIMLCGPLFGEKGLIYTVSKVTGIETEKLDKNAYDLNIDADIDILKGSTALISDDGVFGGCIIESNTQSIIILSESKSLRKNIMKQLIYPYITKLSILPVTTFTDEDDDLESADMDDYKATLDSSDKLPEEDNTVPAKEDAQDLDLQAHDDAATEDKEDFVIDITNADMAKKFPENPENGFDSSLIFEINDNDSSDDNLSVEEKNQKYYLFDEETDEVPNNAGLNISITVVIAFMVLVGILILYIVVAKPLIYHKNILENLRQMFSLNIFKYLYK